MTKLLPIIVAVVAAGGLAASGCTVNATVNGGDGGPGSDSSTSGDDTGTNTDTGVETDTGTDGGTEASTPQANIRLANWSPDSPTAGYDFCVSPHGANTWSGPQLAQAMVSLAFPTVTTYFQLDAGQYDVEIIAAGQTDCTSDAAAPVISNLAALAADSFYTLAFVGDTDVAGSDATLTAVLYGDDAARTDGNVNVRFLNAAPSLTGSTTVDFGTGAQSASTFSATRPESPSRRWPLSRAATLGRPTRTATWCSPPTPARPSSAPTPRPAAPTWTRRRRRAR